jgi:hypothetical protein
MPEPHAPFVPPGALHVARWAQSRGLVFVARPDEAWFRRWEPYDTIAPPQHYFASVTWNAPYGSVVLVEPWTTGEDMEPLERTLMAFGVHPGLTRRAAMKVGDPFMTRVAFIESPPPPKVLLGDAVWDEHVTTFAASPAEARAAFTPKLRALLAAWGFQGHLEIRPAGLCVHWHGLAPSPEGYDRLLAAMPRIVGAAVDASP